jgi:hypothetical protein
MCRHHGRADPLPADATAPQPRGDHAGVFQYEAVQRVVPGQERLAGLGEHLVDQRRVAHHHATPVQVEDVAEALPARGEEADAVELVRVAGRRAEPAASRRRGAAGAGPGPRMRGPARPPEAWDHPVQ